MTVSKKSSNGKSKLVVKTPIGDKVFDRAMPSRPAPKGLTTKPSTTSTGTNSNSKKK